MVKYTKIPAWGYQLWMLLATCIILLGFEVALAQQREPQNIYRVRVQSRYVLEDGQRTRQFYAINQQIQDSLGRIHTEIDYDWETRYPNNYRWHYFEGTTKTKTKYFENEKLVRIEEFDMDTDDRLRELKITTVAPGDTTLQLRVEYNYNPDGTINQAIGYLPNDRRGYRARYRYDHNGTEISRRVRGRRAVPPDSIIRLDREPQYDSLDRIIFEKLTTRMADRSVTGKQVAYEYDNKNNVTGEIIHDANGNIRERRIYSYRRDNRIQRLERFDAEDNLIEYLAWRYEIYRTSDRRHRVLE